MQSTGPRVLCAATPGRGGSALYNSWFSLVTPRARSMPIYSYRCAACGHAKDVLQKLSDPLLTVCPACGAERFTKQVTAAGFQLKGSGWYVTDFRGGDKGGKPAADAAPGEAGAASSTTEKSDAGKPSTDTPGADKSGASTPAQGATPAATQVSKVAAPALASGPSAAGSVS